jgi:electron transfer flavoprotein beta subunit
MKILVCIKQVPDTTDIKWTENNTMQREGVESIINPCDVYALEEALRLKQSCGAEITVLSMGPPQACEMLRHTIALGCDKAVLLSDRAFAGADTFATSKTIAAAIKKITLPDAQAEGRGDSFDLILCGQFAADGDTAQTGPGVANNLGLPQVTYVESFGGRAGELRVEKNKPSTLNPQPSTYLKVKRVTDDGTEILKVELPALLCILQGEYEPSRPLINGIIAGQNAEITVLTAQDLGLAPNEIGLKGSPTFVNKSFRLVTERHPETVDSLETLCAKIKEFNA